MNHKNVNNLTILGGGGNNICPTVTVAICGEELHKFGCDA